MTNYDYKNVGPLAVPAVLSLLGLLQFNIEFFPSSLHTTIKPNPQLFLIEFKFEFTLTSEAEFALSSF